MGANPARLGPPRSALSFPCDLATLHADTHLPARNVTDSSHTGSMPEQAWRHKLFMSHPLKLVYAFTKVLHPERGGT